MTILVSTYNNFVLTTNAYAFLIRSLNTKFAILKLDKGNGIVILKRSNYIDSVNSLFNDPTKFKRIPHDLTSSCHFTGLRTQTFINWGEIFECDHKNLRPAFAHFGRAHGLPKTHKIFQSIPTVRPIIDTTNTLHYNVSKFLAGLLNPLTLNQYSLCYSFDAADAIRSIPPELFSQGYKFVFFYVKSLFTNVPLHRTINIVLDRIYNQKLVDASFRKHTLKSSSLIRAPKLYFPATVLFMNN